MLSFPVISDLGNQFESNSYTETLTHARGSGKETAKSSQLSWHADWGSSILRTEIIRKPWFFISFAIAISWEFCLIVTNSRRAEINQQAGRAAAAAAAFTLLEVLRVDHPGSNTGPRKAACNSHDLPVWIFWNFHAWNKQGIYSLCVHMHVKVFLCILRRVLQIGNTSCISVKQRIFIKVVWNLQILVALNVHGLEKEVIFFSAEIMIMSFTFTNRKRYIICHWWGKGNICLIILYTFLAIGLHIHVRIIVWFIGSWIWEEADCVENYMQSGICF